MGNPVTIELIPGTVTLWHGGRNLKETFQKILGSKKKWENGPGLNLTTHYETAQEYAKGGGALYLVTVEKGTDIKDVRIPLHKVKEFAKRYIFGRKRAEYLTDIHWSMERRKLTDEVDAEDFMNLIINLDALPTSRTMHLQQFLIDNGVDYSFSRKCRGRSETYLIVINPKKILKVRKVSASDVGTDLYILSDHFSPE